ncbi:hypothetical protein [Kangiella marina]|uniref:Uncharacterized protein n=1 Tax=Kangiella marina TaxID=1079178 RepID=A0ABP8IE67_9GAMM
MSHWNRAYLDALEVPVWVPLNDQAEEKASQVENEDVHAAAGDEPSDSEAVIQNDAVTISFIQGDSQADFIFVVATGADKSKAQAALKQMEFAWRLWLEQPFSAALAELSPSSELTTPIEQCKGKVIACGLGESLDHPSIPAPDLDFSVANKRDWWSLLQRLH